ncbi:UNVERIFIED_CONTAM: hypothetical protein H355_015610 [Colinus virginianus]|nr:hypothetical protein H355_015610 [Colinus virginianus]
MRRRRERSLREKSLPVAPEEEEQRAEQGVEEYQCCGLLEQDLAELCARAGIASVPTVTVRPSPATAEGPEPRRLGERCIQVELENDDDPWSVCGVFLRGWRVEEEMLGVLSKCLPALGNLQTLHTFLIPPLPQGLRWNRSLQSLSLAHNHIGDAGALKLAEVLQPFVLTHTEVVERRRLLMEAQGQPRAQAESSSRHALSLQGSVAANKLSPAKQSKGTAKKKVRSSSHSAPPAVTASPDPRPNRSRGVKGVIKEQQITEVSKTFERGDTFCRGPRILRTPSRCAQALDPPEPTHPLLEPGWHRDGNVILPGNRVLLNLNLSDNHITERGLGALLAALERQQQEGAGGGLGLMRLSLKRNSFPSACEAFTRLQELLQERDTLPKPGGQKEEQDPSP